MNYLSQIASDASRSAYTFFSQGLQKTGEWGGHIVRYLQQTPQLLEQHPYAAIATLATTNLVFLGLIGGITNRFVKPVGEDGKFSSKQRCISASVIIGSSVAFNFLFSRITKMALDPVILGIICVANVIFFELYQYLKRSNVAPKEVKQTSPTGEKKQPTPTKKEEDTPKLLEKTPQPSPEKLPRIWDPIQIQTEPQNPIQAKRSMAEQAEEVTKAYRVLVEQGEVVGKISKLEADCEQLKLDKESLENQRKAEQKKDEKAFKDFQAETEAKSKLSDHKIELLTSSLVEATKEKELLEGRINILKQESGLAVEAKTKLQTELDAIKQAKEQVQEQLAVITQKFGEVSQNLIEETEEKLRLENAKNSAEFNVESLNALIDDLEAQLAFKDKIIKGFKAKSDKGLIDGQTVPSAENASGTSSNSSVGIPATPQTTRGRTPQKTASPARSVSMNARRTEHVDNEEARKLEEEKSRQRAYDKLRENSTRKKPQRGIALPGMTAQTPSQPTAKTEEAAPLAK